MTKLYQIYQGEELRVAEKIQQRRLQLLVHSCIYYDLNDNIVSDDKWLDWAAELAELQTKYPEIEKNVPYRDGFENWDPSTGAFLPYKTEQIRRIAERLLRNGSSQRPRIIVPEKPKIVNNSTARKKLF